MTNQEKAYAHLAKSVYEDIIGYTRAVIAERDALQAKLQEQALQIISLIGQEIDAEPLTDTYVQKVPDKCDRIVWRNTYYHLPITQPKADDEMAPHDQCWMLTEVHKK